MATWYVSAEDILLNGRGEFRLLKGSPVFTKIGPLRLPVRIEDNELVLRGEDLVGTTIPVRDEPDENTIPLTVIWGEEDEDGPGENGSLPTKLWLLRPREDIKWPYDNPWDSWYDRTFGFVIRAAGEDLARRIAAENSETEGRNAWLDSNLSVCEELVPEGDIGVIIRESYQA